MKSQHDFPSLNQKQADGIRPGGKPYRVLVVEDKEFHRKQIAQILESEEYEIAATASNGKEALDMLDKNLKDIDLITTNLDMPILDGYALLYELGQKNLKLKTVFISDDTTKGVLEDLLGMGAAGFILKPINRDRILKRIKTILQKGE
ncbi:MAG: response regulator [Spirochaetota bacterium]|nr:response regulator [Spirochaetota bacterium]